MLIKENGDIVTKFFDIYKYKENLICIFEIYLNGEYILFKYINHKLITKDIWIL